MKAYKTRDITLMGVLIALALVFGYVEFLIPLPVNVPGVKLGLGNIVVLFALIAYGRSHAFVIMLIKVVASSILFGNPSIFMYSLAGGILSYLVMALAYRSDRMSLIGVSTLGGIFHNVGQLIVVYFVFNYLVVLANLPVLLIAGLITGAVTGQITRLALNAVKKPQPGR